MPTRISPDSIDIPMRPILEELAKGNCVGLPTETVYGLAADATNGRAVAKIFEMKGRPKFNPLICHVSGLEMAGKYGEFNTVAEKLANAFWPGPFTLVVPLKDVESIHPLVSADLGTVGIRAPKGIASRIIAEFGKPLAMPSANRSGKISPTLATHVEEQFAGTDLLVVDAGACDIGIESTIVKVDGNNLTLLRPGSITPEMIVRVTGITPILPDADKIEAPGMMKSHYAPDAKVILNCTECPADQALLKFGRQLPENSGKTVLNLSETGDTVEAAANLYAMLKQLDDTGTEVICVEPIPQTGLGSAINDRLQRSAAPRNA